MARMKTSEAKFLSPSAKEAFAQENTDRLARQELDADLLVDVPGALFESTWIERARITEDEFLNKLKSFEISLKKIVIGVDPAVTTKNTSDMTGIVVLGVAFDNHLYVLQDHTRRWTPHDWALKVRSLYLQYCKTCTTKIAIETNQGGDLVIANLTSLDGKLKSAIEPTWSVNDKRVRAQALAAKYQRGIVHHVGTIPLLERQMTTYVNDSNDSPDALDALVHAANYILFTPKAPKRDLSILEGL
jgi:phage terminase large subunit-like protein